MPRQMAEKKKKAYEINYANRFRRWTNSETIKLHEIRFTFRQTWNSLSWSISLMSKLNLFSFFLLTHVTLSIVTNVIGIITLYIHAELVWYFFFFYSLTPVRLIVVTRVFIRQQQKGFAMRHLFARKNQKKERKVRESWAWFFLLIGQLLAPLERHLTLAVLFLLDDWRFISLLL